MYKGIEFYYSLASLVFALQCGGGDGVVVVAVVVVTLYLKYVLGNEYLQVSSALFKDLSKE